MMKSKIDIITEIAKISIGRDELVNELKSAKEYGVLTLEDEVELYSSGGHENIVEAITAALNYIYRINRTKLSDRVVFNKKEL